MPNYLNSVIQQLQEELETVLKSAQVAHQAATHEESKAEDQHDTRGLEAAYLASAQMQRAEEIEKSILYFKTQALGEIQLYTLKCMGKTKTYLVARRGGGIHLKDENTQVITFDSPLGAELTHRQVGEEFEIERPDGARVYQVIAIGKIRE